MENSCSKNSNTNSLDVARPPPPVVPMEFLTRSWAASAAAAAPEVYSSKAPSSLVGPIPEDAMGELEEDEQEVEDEQVVAGNPFTLGSSTATSQLVIERILSHSQDVSSITPGRLSHSSGPLNGGQSGGSQSDSPPVSPCDIDDYCRGNSSCRTPHCRPNNKTVGRWLKERKEKKKEETRAHNAQLHAAVQVAGVAAAVAAIAAATAAAASGSCKGDRAAKTDVAVASAATLVATQCVEAAEALGADREHLAAVVGSAVSVHSPEDVITLTASAATALRGAATLKARVLKEVWNIAAVIPVEKGPMGDHCQRHQRRNHQLRHVVERKDDESSGEICNEENFLGQCSQEFLARGTDLLKRTRKGALHWKIVSVYVHRTGVVMLKMKSRHVAGTITKKKKCVICDVCKDVAAWPGRHLLEGGQDRRYFGLKTAEERVIEFECRSQREYEMWTHGVSRLLSIVRENGGGRR